jgi:hypothetical protein
MGHKRIGTLEEVPPTTSQEQVEESANLEISEDKVDGQATDEQQTDVPAPEPAVVQTKSSYTKVGQAPCGFWATSEISTRLQEENSIDSSHSSTIIPSYKQSDLAFSTKVVGCLPRFPRL